MPQRINRSVIIWFLVFLLGGVKLARGEEMDTQTFTYTITNGGTMVGSVSAVAMRNATLQIIDILTRVNSGDNGEHSPTLLLTRSRSEWQNKKLSHFDHWIVVEKERWHLMGKRMDESLFVSARQVKTKQQRELDETVELAQMLAAGTIPHASTAMTILSLFSDQESEGEEAVPFDYYDITDLELHEYLMHAARWHGTRKLKLFFTGELERRRVELRYRGKKELRTPAGSYLCEGFDLQDGDEMTTLWLTRDTDWGALVVQEISTMDNKEYVVTLQKVEEEPAVSL